MISEATTSLLLSRPRTHLSSVAISPWSVVVRMVLTLNVPRGAVDGSSSFVCCVSSTLLNKGSLLSSSPSFDSEKLLSSLLL